MQGGNSNTIRTFIAFKIDEPTITSNFSKIQQEFKNIDGKIKFVELHNIHLTIKFLGDTSIENARKILEIIDDIDVVPENGFDIEVKHLGVFDKRKPRVLWCNVEDEQGVIMKAHDTIDEQLSGALGIPRDTRKFKGHVTIARIRYLKDKREFFDLVEKNKDRVFGRQHIDKIHFIRSVLTPKGPIYSEITWDALE